MNQFNQTKEFANIEIGEFFIYEFSLDQFYSRTNEKSCIFIAQKINHSEIQDVYHFGLSLMNSRNEICIWQDDYCQIELVLGKFDNFNEVIHKFPEIFI